MRVVSAALMEWQSTGLLRLDELEGIHEAATGPRPGRRWGTQQLNRSLFVALVAQFQTYCRNLHDAAIDIHAAGANEAQGALLRTLMTQGRKLDTQTPRASVLGSGFGRLGFNLVEAVKAEGADAEVALARLEVLVDFRNAIGHGNETEIADLVGKGEIKATKRTYRRYRRTLERLARRMDRVVATKLGDLLSIPPPW
jgi:hypothetical protein